jgi:tetratricopeptide (TPR) repeat protein
LALARYQVQRGNYQQAQATVQQLLLVSPNHLEGKVLLGQIQFQQGKRTDGIDTFGRLASQNRFPVAYALLARALHASGDQQAAGEAVSTVLEWPLVRLRCTCGLSIFRLEKANARKALMTARTYPGPEADVILVDTLLRLKREHEAEALLKTSVRANSDFRVAMRLRFIA